MVISIALIGVTKIDQVIHHQFELVVAAPLFDADDFSKTKILRVVHFICSMEAGDKNPLVHDTSKLLIELGTQHSFADTVAFIIQLVNDVFDFLNTAAVTIDRVSEVTLFVQTLDRFGNFIKTVDVGLLFFSLLHHLPLG